MLSYLPAEFFKSKSVETLLLNGCSKFRELPEGLGEMISLTTLKADYTAIRQVPTSIVKLKKLRSLSLWGVMRGSTFNLLPPSLHGLNSLRELDLSLCSLTDDTIPKDLKSLVCLQDLYLQKNNFCTLPSLSCLSNLEVLGLNDCTSLRAIPDLPKKLKDLRALRCTMLETMPDFSEMSNTRKLYLSDSPQLTEVPGLDKSLNSMTRIHMEGCTKLTADFRKKIQQVSLSLSKYMYMILTYIVQGWTSCGFGGIFLNGIYDIPEWFEFVDEGKVDFDIPQSDGRNFKGFTLCLLYSSNKKDADPLGITVINYTKRTALDTWMTWASVPTSRESLEDNYLWQGQLSNNKLNLQGADKVGIFVDTADDSVMVNKIGVNIVWDKFMKENTHDSYLPLYGFDPHPDWLYDGAGASEDASDHPSNQMSSTKDEVEQLAVLHHDRLGLANLCTD